MTEIAQWREARREVLGVLENVAHLRRLARMKSAAASGAAEIEAAIAVFELVKRYPNNPTVAKIASLYMK